MLEFDIVKFRKWHLPELKRICDQLGKFPFPDITNPLCIVRCTVLDENENIVGGGFIKLHAEATIYIDQSLPIYKRARLVDYLFKFGVERAKDHGLDNLHVFLFGMRSFRNYLIKKLGFSKVDADCLEIKLR